MDFIKVSCGFYFVLILYTFQTIKFKKVTKSTKHTKTEVEQADIKVSKGPPWEVSKVSRGHALANFPSDVLCEFLGCRCFLALVIPEGCASTLLVLLVSHTYPCQLFFGCPLRIRGLSVLCPPPKIPKYYRITVLQYYSIIV